MKNEKCGIYQIQCRPTGGRYVGSSARIYSRWSEHRRQLRLVIHHSWRLQEAWSRYGEASFDFSILHECEREALEFAEQHWITLLRPLYNIVTNILERSSPEIKEKRAASLRARAALITHCPKGHPYDETNTMIHQGKRICRKCNAERVAGIYAAETPEQREKRRQRAKQQAAREKDRTQRAAYTASHKAEKQAYDKVRRERIAGRPMGIPPAQKTHCPAGHAYTPENTYLNKVGFRQCRACVLEWAKQKRLAETPDQREARLAAKRAYSAREDVKERRRQK